MTPFIAGGERWPIGCKRPSRRNGETLDSSVATEAYIYVQSGRIRVAAADGPPANDRPIDKALRMALYGNLAMVPLPQLLAWVGSSRRNGCLQIRHDKATTNLFFHGGRIVACSSDDPSKLLGQFLLYRGVIDEAGLCQAMAEQEVGGKLLGGILVEKGKISSERLARELSLKVEETILGVFEWEDGAFAFIEGASPGTNSIKIGDGIPVHELISRGTKRLEDRARILSVFTDRRVRLKRTEKPLPQNLREDWPTQRIYQSIDGKRSFEDITLLAHGSEFLVGERLLKLYETGLIATEDGDDAAEETASESGAHPEAGVRDQSTAEEGFRAENRREATTAAQVEVMRPSATSAVSTEDAPELQFVHWLLAADVTQQREGQPSAPIPSEGEATGGIERARLHFSREEYGEALDLLDAACLVDPGDAAVRQLRDHAQRALIRQIVGNGVIPSRVPVVISGRGDPSKMGRSPTEEFLLKLCDGSWDVRSLTWVAAVRTVDTLRAIRALMDRGIIELREGP